MCVYGGVAGRARQILTITVGDMLSSLRVTEPLGQSEVNNIDIVLLFADTNEEIVRFDVTMKEVTRMDKLNALQLPRTKQG